MLLLRIDEIMNGRMLAGVVGMNNKRLTVREVKTDPESTPFQPTP
jgi:hypothetical protein